MCLPLHAEMNFWSDMHGKIILIFGKHGEDAKVKSKRLAANYGPNQSLYQMLTRKINQEKCLALRACN